MFGKHVDTEFVLVMFLPEFDLGEYLVGERVAHNEWWMTMRTPEVNKTAFSQQNDVFAVGECVSVDLNKMKE